MRTGSGMSVGLWTSTFAAVGERHLEAAPRARSRAARGRTRARGARARCPCAAARGSRQRKPKPSASERLGLEAQRGVVELELVERVAQLGVAVGVDREEPAEDHRLDLAVAWQRLSGGIRARRQRVADAQLRDVLDAGDQVADLAGAERLGRGHLRREEADVVDLGTRLRRHRADRLALGEGAVDDADVGDDAAVLVELRVEDQRARRALGIARRRRHLLRRSPRARPLSPSPSWPRSAAHRRPARRAARRSPRRRAPARRRGRSILFRHGISSRPASTAR